MVHVGSGHQRLSRRAGGVWRGFPPRRSRTTPGRRDALSRSEAALCLETRERSGSSKDGHSSGTFTNISNKSVCFSNGDRWFRLLSKERVRWIFNNLCGTAQAGGKNEEASFCGSRSDCARCEQWEKLKHRGWLKA